MNRQGQESRQPEEAMGIHSATFEVSGSVMTQCNRTISVTAPPPAADPAPAEASHPAGYNPSPPGTEDKPLFCPIDFHDSPPVTKSTELRNQSISDGPSTEPEQKKLFCPIDFHGPSPGVKTMELDDSVIPNNPSPEPEHNGVIHYPIELVVPDHSRVGYPEVNLGGFKKPAEAQKADANCKAMQDALTPRRPDGTLIDHLEVGQCTLAKIPVFHAPENLAPGCLYNPVAEASEFEDGKLPSDLSYVDGFVISRKLPDGQTYLEIKYDDAVLNLSDEQRSALELGQKMKDFSSGKQQMPASKGPEVLPHSADPVGIIDNPDDGCMYIGGKRGSVKITNFRVRAVESRFIIGKLESEGPRTEYVIEVLRGSISRTITLTSAELDNAVKLIQNELPSCIVFPTVQKPQIQISNHIREQLNQVPEKVYVQRTGFLKLGNRWVYVHDGATPPDPNTVFDTGRYIPNDHRVSDVQAFHNAMDFLGVSNKDELIIPLFLLAHLGPMFQLFHDACRTPRFVTVLAGRSGSLKTSLSLVLFRLFQDQGQTPTASFRDTETAMEIKLGELNGSVGIFDDLRPPVSDFKSKANAEKLESIVRAVGDHVAKGRSNVKLGRAKEFVPSGMALLTAEDISGSQSSLLRCLVLSIAKGDIDGSKLRHFQNNPDLIPTHMSRFLTWVGNNANGIMAVLEHEYPNYMFQNVVSELRLVDTAAILWTVGFILSLYAERIGALSCEQADQFQERCYNAICTAIVASESMSKEANPCVMYLSAFFDLCDRGEIQLAENSSFYTPEGCDGYLSDGCAWVNPHTIYAKVRQYYSRLNIVFPLTEKQLSVHLADAELIKVTEGSKSNPSKRNFTHKSSLSSRKHMQVLYLDRAYAYLEDQAN